LIAVLKYSKSILIWDMVRCEDYGNCGKPIYTIDSQMMGKIGVKYFSPLIAYTSDFHPYVLFIQTT
jgi:hypothetical protein